MISANIASGTVHTVPADLETVLSTNDNLVTKWNGLTPLARNEWICWMTLVKKPETRAKHLARLKEEILDGKRRPCCWPGCPHCNENAKKWFK